SSSSTSRRRPWRASWGPLWACRYTADRPSTSYPMRWPRGFWGWSWYSPCGFGRDEPEDRPHERIRSMPNPSRTPLQEYPARRIALIKPSALGDIVQSLPVLTALRRRFPTASICWVVNRSYEPLLSDHPDLDATLAFDRAAVRSNLLEAALAYTDFLRRFRRQH